MITESHIVALLSLKANVQAAHWSADTLTNAHAALGKLYSALDEWVDQFVETASGHINKRFLVTGTAVISSVQPSELIQAGLKVCASLKAALEPGKDDGLLNQVADLKNILDHEGRYFLKI